MNTLKPQEKPRECSIHEYWEEFLKETRDKTMKKMKKSMGEFWEEFLQKSWDESLKKVRQQSLNVSR